MPATWQPRPEAESLHIISLTRSYGKAKSARALQTIRRVGFLQKLSTVNDVTKYRGAPVSRHFWDGILSSGILSIPRIPMCHRPRTVATDDVMASALDWVMMTRLPRGIQAQSPVQMQAVHLLMYAHWPPPQRIIHYVYGPPANGKARRSRLGRVSFRDGDDVWASEGGRTAAHRVLRLARNFRRRQRMFYGATRHARAPPTDLDRNTWFQSQAARLVVFFFRQPTLYYY